MNAFDIPELALYGQMTLTEPKPLEADGSNDTATELEHSAPRDYRGIVVGVASLEMVAVGTFAAMEAETHGVRAIGAVAAVSGGLALKKLVQSRGRPFWR